MTIYHNNVVIGSYGSGRATLKYSGNVDFTNMIYLGGQGHGENTVENLIFDSTYGGTTEDHLPQAVGVGGKGDAVLGCQFLNVDYAVNAQADPSGLLVQNNTAPLSTGLRGYFVWGEGDDFVILGNTVANSTHEHIVRIAGVDRLNISDNNFTNTIDSYDNNIIRGTITIHKGTYAYISGNTLNSGIASVGPLGRGAGLDDKAARFNWIVIENNTINSQFVFLMGSQHIMFRNNVVNANNTWGLEAEGYDTQYARGVVDLTIANNTVVNSGTQGNFLHVDGPVDGISLVNNLYVAPKLITGSNGSAPVFVFDSDLSSFSTISGNVWPAPTILQYANGGINYVWPTWSNTSGYKSPAAWNAYGVVGTDYFSDVSFNTSTDAPSTSSVAASAASVWNGVFTDMNGKLRSATGSWTAGAVEV